MATTTRTVATNTQPSRVDLSQIRTKGRNLPSRMLVHGVEGVGKSSFARWALGSCFGLSRGETGIETLIDAGQVPPTPFFPEAQTWEEFLSVVRTLRDEDHEFKTFVIDTINGVERLCHEHVCNTEFHGDWGEKGFTSFQKGYEVALSPWRDFLSMLDELREKKNMAIIGLCHTRVAPFRNPEGADYDRFAPDMHWKTWGLTHKWADIVMFANFDTIVDEKAKKAKGGQMRTLYTVRHAAYDAKNRNGLPETIDMGDSGKEAWANFIKAMKTKGQAK